MCNTSAGGHRWRNGRRRRADFGIAAVHGLIPRVEAGEPLLMLGGIHIGCSELFGSDRVRSMRDFKGKKIAVTRLGSARHILTAAMAAHVGLDPRKDIDWIENPAAEAIRLFAEGKIDGFIGFPPRAPGTQGEEDWPRSREHDDGPAVVPILLLHAVRQQGVRPAPSDCHKRALRISSATALAIGGRAAFDPCRQLRRQYDYRCSRKVPYARWRDMATTVRFYAPPE
jgi:NitT/TauT family transport system substrate-binding protein